MGDQQHIPKGDKNREREFWEFVTPLMPQIRQAARGVSRATSYFDAEDLLSSTLLRIADSYRHHRFDPDFLTERRLLAYFKMAMRWRYFDKVRQEMRRRELLHSRDVADVDQSCEVEIGDAVTATHEYLDRVMPGMSEVFRLRAKGVPTKEIAASMNISYDVLRQRIHRAAKRIFDEMPDTFY